MFTNSKSPKLLIVVCVFTIPQRNLELLLFCLLEQRTYFSVEVIRVNIEFTKT